MGLPTPPTYLTGKKTDRGVTNVRNPGSPHWRRWLGPAHRCLVPLTRFAEPDTVRGGSAWFALSDDRPAFFAGLFVPGWTSVRKLKDGPTTDDLFAFLTTEANPDVAAVHPRRCPSSLPSRRIGTPGSPPPGQRPRACRYRWRRVYSTGLSRLRKGGLCGNVRSGGNQRFATARRCSCSWHCSWSLQLGSISPRHLGNIRGIR